MNALISKARRPKFELTLKIIDLNNVPLVSGTSMVKWHLPSSTSAEHRGRTDKAPIIEHKVTWDYEKMLPVRLTMDKTNMLQECLIDFEIVQDYSSGARGEKIRLGHVTLNLSEYVEMEGVGEDGEEGVTRRYLMQESKINSTLMVGIAMKQIDGEKNFIAPPLRTALVFGGIAGIMSGEHMDQKDDMGYIPSMNRTREMGEMHDMYRKSLAAHWVGAQAGELPADKCIEDIFNGGDGWGSKSSQDTIPSPRHRHIPGHQDSDEESFGGWHHRNRKRHTRTGSESSGRSTVTGRTLSANYERKVSKNREHIMDQRGPNHGLSGMGSTGNNNLHRQGSYEDSDRGWSSGGFKHAREVDEFEVRDDLMSWQLGGSTAEN